VTSLGLLLLDVVVPVFAVVAMGWWIGRRFGIAVAPVSRLAMYAAVPALVFRAMNGIALAPASFSLLAPYASFLALMALLGWGIGIRWPAGPRRALIGTSMLGNAANLNLPIAAFAFGPLGLERALLLYVMTALATFGIGPALLGYGTSWRATVRRIVGFPVAWAAVIGLGMGAWGVTLPTGALRTVTLLADAAVPMVLLALGVHMAGVTRRRPNRRVLMAVAVKVGVAPLVAWGLARLFALDALDTGVLVTLGAMPTAINASMLAVEFGGEVEQVSETVVLGTLVSLATLPVVLAAVGGG
jgi:malate permease and related proteins